MHGYETKEEMECCLAAHKKEIVACLAVMVMFKMVLIGLVCSHKHHHHDCHKKWEQKEEQTEE